MFEFDRPLKIRVTPKASANRIKVENLNCGEIFLRIYITVAAEDGKANRAVINLLAKEFGLPKTAFTITHGLLCRDKTIVIKRRD